MGRKRTHNRGLPERLYLRGRQYVYLPLGQTKYVKMGCTLADALDAYARLMRGAEDTIPRTIGDCMDSYLASSSFARLAPRTKLDYQRDITRLRRTFGHMPPADLTRADIYHYMRTRSPTRARLEVAVLLNVLEVAVRCGLINANPCRDLRYEPTAKRTRAPSIAEVRAFCAGAGDQVALYVRLKVATGLRMGDMLRLDRRMITDAGLTVPTGKTGRTLQFLARDAEGNSTGLAELLREILALRRRVAALALFATRDGQHYTTDGWKSIWQRRMAAYVAAGGVHFREHDLRATAGIAKEERHGRGAARDLLGHELESTTARYTGRRKVVKITPSGA